MTQQNEQQTPEIRGMWQRWLQEISGKLRCISGNMLITLGDRVGGNRLSVRNAGDTEVFGVSSLGAVSGATGTFSGAVSGTTGTFSSGVSVPRSSGAALFALDSSQLGAGFNIGGSTGPGWNNGTTTTPLGTPGGGGNFSGLILVSELTFTGSLGLFLCGGAATFLLAETVANIYGTAAATANRANVYYASNNITVKNNLSGAATFNLTAIRARAAA